MFKQQNKNIDWFIIKFFMRFILIFMIFYFFASCSKSKTYQAEGTLTGVDYRMCVCCGGVVIEVKDMTGNYRVDSLPLMSVQKLYNLTSVTEFFMEY